MFPSKVRLEREENFPRFFFLRIRIRILAATMIEIRLRQWMGVGAYAPWKGSRRSNPVDRGTVWGLPGPENLTLPTLGWIVSCSLNLPRVRAPCQTCKLCLTASIMVSRTTSSSQSSWRPMPSILVENVEVWTTALTPSYHTLHISLTNITRCSSICASQYYQFHKDDR